METRGGFDIKSMNVIHKTTTKLAQNNVKEQKISSV